MRALITNDDGIESMGLWTLAHAAREAGFDVVVAAPAWDSSGASASLTSVQEEGRFLVHDAELAGEPLDGVVAIGVEAAPAFIVRAAVHGAFGDPPDIVLSGVNDGPNTGHAILHSGTVGAAFTAATFGRPSAAFSLHETGRIPHGERHWDTADVVAQAVLRFLPEFCKPDVVVNVNIPDVPPSDLKGIKPATLAQFGAVQTHVTETGKGYVKIEHTPLAVDYQPGTDAYYLSTGYACFTPLRPVCAAGDEEMDRLAGSLERDFSLAK